MTMGFVRTMTAERWGFMVHRSDGLPVYEQLDTLKGPIDLYCISPEHRVFVSNTRGSIWICQCETDDVARAYVKELYPSAYAAESFLALLARAERCQISQLTDDDDLDDRLD